MISRREALTMAGVWVATAVGARAADQNASTADDFTFVHFTDTHIQTELGGVEGCRRCFREINASNPKFVIAGGDLVRDVSRSDETDARRQYRLYLDAEKELTTRVYRTVGNHDLRGTAAGLPVATDAAKGLYEDHFGARYYSFDQGRWHFIVVDSVQVSAAGGYVGTIDERQLAWLAGDLAAVGRERPIVLSTHIPLASVWSFVSPRGRGPGGADIPLLAIENSNAVIEQLLRGYNVKAVLQGHTHVLERVEMAGIQYVTTGAVCGAWWRGPHYGTPGGFAECRIRGDKISIDYRPFARA